MTRRPTRTAPAPPPRGETEPPRVIGVIDIGATAVRMEIAEVRPEGGTRTIEALSRPVALGKDTFTRGVIPRETTETCVRVLRQFRAVLRGYGIDDPAQVNAVATSAVREARNRDRFLARIQMATGIPVVCIDEVELSRLTYLAARDVLTRGGVPAPWNVMVIEIGGGSTELLLIRQGRVAFSETYRLGSLRMRESLETYRVPPRRSRRLLEQGIDRTVQQMRRSMEGSVPALLAMSGDVRFAAARLCRHWDEVTLARLRPAALDAFTDRILGMTPDQLVRTYRLAYPDAESVGPALLSCVRIAQAFGAREILVPKTHLRTALELEMAADTIWTSDFCAQIEHAARALARKFCTDLRHAEHVAWLAGLLFDALREEHQLSPRHGFLLRIAALLHEVGLFVSSRSHHKHSMYLILNSDLFGLTREDILLVALVARYHRRSPPQPTHPAYAQLDRERQLVVQQLAALLRTACALDRNHTQRVRDVDLRREGDRLQIAVGDLDDVALERHALREKGTLFEDVYGLPVELVRGPPPKGPEANV